MSRWYLKTFRIFDSPNKDVPDKPVIEGSYDIGLANVFIKAHNKDIGHLLAENKELKEELGHKKAGLSNLRDYVADLKVKAGQLQSELDKAKERRPPN